MTNQEKMAVNLFDDFADYPSMMIQFGTITGTYTPEGIGDFLVNKFGLREAKKRANKIKKRLSTSKRLFWLYGAALADAESKAMVNGVFEAQAEVDTAWKKFNAGEIPPDVFVATVNKYSKIGNYSKQVLDVEIEQVENESEKASLRDIRKSFWTDNYNKSSPILRFVIVEAVNYLLKKNLGFTQEKACGTVFEHLSLFGITLKNKRQVINYWQHHPQFQSPRLIKPFSKIFLCIFIQPVIGVFITPPLGREAELVAQLCPAIYSILDCNNLRQLT